MKDRGHINWCKIKKITLKKYLSNPFKSII